MTDASFFYRDRDHQVSGDCPACLPALIADDLRVGAIAAVFAHQQIIFIRDNAVASFLAGALDLGAQVDFVVLQQFDRLPIGADGIPG